MDEFVTSAELVEVIQTIRTPRRFFLDRFFRATPYLSTTANIVFEEVLQDLPAMAPFVSPVVQAKPQKRAGNQAKIFTPAYVKPKHFVKPGDFMRRTPGEALFGDISPAARYDAARLDLLALQKRQIEERWEWMAAQAIVTGKVLVTGEDYPTVEVDFGRAASHDIVLTGAGDVWSNEDADIEGQFEDWSDKILEATGFSGTDVVMSPEAWKRFKKNKSFLKQLDVRRGVENVPSISPTAATQGVSFRGKWGEYNLWTYAGRFKEEDGTRLRAIEADDIVMTAAPAEEDGTGGVHGIKAFGAIQDKKAGLQALDIFAKSWEEEDPSGEQLMSQSAPLMIPGRPNATVRVSVA